VDLDSGISATDGDTNVIDRQNRYRHEIIAGYGSDRLGWAIRNGGSEASPFMDQVGIQTVRERNLGNRGTRFSTRCQNPRLQVRAVTAPSVNF
jgi:hypothetical protein